MSNARFGFRTISGQISELIQSSVVDADALAFITAAGITDATQKSAITALVANMKSAGIWNKMKAVYPFVGGTASTHKWNLKDPRDLDAAFRLSFLGGWTHTSNGITGNASNTYAQTFLVPNTTLTLNNAHISVYNRTNNGADYIDIGINDNPSVVLNTYKIQSRWSDGNCYYNINSGTQNSFANASALGFYIANRVDSANQKLYKNNTINTGVSAAQSLSTKAGGIFIGAWNNTGGTLYFSNRNYAFASIGEGLNDTEAANFYTAVQNFNTILARQI
jgi:hypothetical protein